MSMQIRLMLFALYRDLAGVEEMTLDLPVGATARDAVSVLRGRSSGLGRLPAAPVVARNRVYAGLDDRLEEGDELALLPPVAGG
jgi:molybdopterin converting factor small subunit